MSSTLVIDTSVAIKWYVPEPGHQEAVSLLKQGLELVAPDLVVAEFGNILWKKTRTGELKGQEAEEIAESFISACPITLYPASVLLPAAVHLAVSFDRAVYDCLFLALAAAESTQCVTADRVLIRALEGTEIENLVMALGS